MHTPLAQAKAHLTHAHYVATFLAACVCVLSVLCLYQGGIIHQTKIEDKKETKQMLCFNRQGEVTSKEDWIECKTVMVREMEDLE